jgi:hypothetical protein
VKCRIFVRAIKCEVLHLLKTFFCANRNAATIIGLHHVTNADVLLPTALLCGAIINAIPGELMSRKRKKNLLTISQLSRYELLILTICVVCLAPFYANGQKAPGSSNPQTVNKSCEGNLPPQASAHQDQSGTEGGTDRLRLSTKTTQASSEPQGQFCRRERSGQNSLRPSVSSDQPDAAPESSQPAAAPPIAQVTDGKLTIRANGQDFSSVLESVRSVTGMTLEMPPGANSDPVFLNVGPANVGDALVALLDGTNYNYIIVGSEQDSRVVKRLILTERTSVRAGTLVASTQGMPVASQPSLYGGVQPDTDAEASEPPVPIQPAAISSSIPTGINVQKLAAESGKTIGQILDELQKQQEQVLDAQAAAQAQSGPQQ